MAFGPHQPGANARSRIFDRPWLVEPVDRVVAGRPDAAQQHQRKERVGLDRHDRAQAFAGFDAILDQDQPRLHFLDDRQRFAFAADPGEGDGLVGDGPRDAVCQVIAGRHQQQVGAFARRTAADGRHRIRGIDRERAGSCAADLQDQAFGCGDDFRPAIGRRVAQPLERLVDIIVGAHRVMVRQRDPARARSARDQHGIVERAVPPAALGRIFLRQVLGIVDDQVGAGHELGVRQIFALQFGLTVRHVGGVRFVIAGVDHAGAVAFDAERQRQRGVVQVARLDRDIVDDEATFAQVVIAHGCAEGLGRDREIGIFHLPRERVLERFAEALRRVEVPFMARHEERREEGDALDVIPMGMADQHVPA